MSSVDLALAGSKQAIPSPARGRSVVISVIRHTVIPGKDREYEAWLRVTILVAENAEGHRGVSVIRPHTGSRTYTIVLHFDAPEHLRQCLASEAWKRLMLEVQHLLQDGEEVEIKTRLEFWFRPRLGAEARKTLQAIPGHTVGNLPAHDVGSLVADAGVPFRTHPRDARDQPLARCRDNCRADDLCHHTPLHTAWLYG